MCFFFFFFFLWQTGILSGISSVSLIFLWLFIFRHLSLLFYVLFYFVFIYSVTSLLMNLALTCCVGVVVNNLPFFWD